MRIDIARTKAIAFLLLFTSSLFDTTTAFAKNSSSSGSSGRVEPWAKYVPIFDVTLGSGQMTQTLDEMNKSYPPGFRVGSHVHYGPFEFGVSYSGLYHSASSSPGTANQTNSADQFTLTALNVGLLIGRSLIVEAGYGTADFSRGQSQPKAATTTNVTAQGTGWEAGGTWIPVHIGSFGLGATYYYFDAKATSYDSSSVVGNARTTKSGTSASVHTTGYLAGLTLLWNL